MNIDYNSFELELVKNTSTLIVFAINDYLTRFYLKEDFSIINNNFIFNNLPNCIYQDSKSEFHVVNDDNIYIYQYIIEYIEEIYKKLKENEEIEKELNKVETTTQRKRVKI